MTDKQRRFCDEYMANGGNAYQAALSAGYEDSTARDAALWVLQKTGKNRSKYKPELVEYIAEHSGEMERHNSKIATAEEIQEFLSQVFRGELTDTAVSVTGKITTDVPTSMKDRLKAADQLSKVKGMYTTRIDADIREVMIIDDFGPDDDRE